MALLHSTLLYITLPWLYWILINSKLLYHGSMSLYFTLHDSNMALLHSTSFCIIQTLLYLTLLHSTLLYHGYFTLLDSTLHYPCSTKFTKHDSTMSLLHSTLFYIFLQWLYFTLYFILHDSTVHLLHSTFLYHGSISLFTT